MTHVQRANSTELVASAPFAPSGSAKLDVLRSFAVLTVLLSHVWFEHDAIAATGRVGVLLFFLHTSLVLMFSLERQERVSGDSRLFSTFMLRRVLRIYPLSTLVVLAVYLFSVPAYAVGGHVYHFDIDALDFAASLLLVQDIVHSFGGAGSQLGVLWTLPVEMQMYLTLPLLFLFVRRFTDLRLLLAIWAVTAIGAIGAPGAISRITNGGPVATFDWGWITFPRILEFMPHFLAGVLAYVVWRRTRIALPFGTLPAYLATFVLGYYGMATLFGKGHALNAFGMIACLGLGLLLPSIREPSSGAVRRLSAMIARYSYGIYLVHVSCLWLGMDVLDEAPRVVQWIVFLGSTLAVSALLHHVVEQPFIRLGAALGRRWSRPVRQLSATPAPVLVTSHDARGGVER